MLRRHGRAPDPHRRAGRRHAVRGPARREGRDRRRRRGGRLGRRRLAADRRVGAGRGRPGRRRRRRHGQRRRPARRPRHPRRGRHPARPDGAAGRGRPERQGRGAAPGRPDLRRLRADRDRARRRHPRVLARHRRGVGRGVHGRGRGADHRVPVCARAGHADRAHGRHRPRRPARHPDQGPEVLESTRRVDTVVLDKTGTVTTGQMSLAGVVAAHGEDADRVLLLAGALEDASEHPIARAVAAAARDRQPDLPLVDGFANLAGRGVRGKVDEGGKPVDVLVGRPSLLAEHGLPDARRARGRARRRPRVRRHRRRGRLGRPGPRPPARSPTP